LPHTEHFTGRTTTREYIVLLKHTVEEFIGISPAVRAIRAEIEYAASCSAKVLITGESGVGKEIASRLIHQLSDRAHAPFVAINCVGVPESLLESELFGHVRGSFTGAHRDRPGLLETANRGTLFLDEVADMGLRMQGVLLRFLETGEIQRVGADRSQSRLDVRVIAATNKDPLQFVAAKEFREDLYYRLNVIDITIPPLRARREDIPVLFEHFVERCSDYHRVPRPTYNGELLEAIQEYEWPGNVRQLRNVVERLVVRSRGGLITPELLPFAGITPTQTNGTTVYPAAGTAAAPAAATAAAAAAVERASRSVADTMFNRMVHERESFWSIVYSAYMARELTRSDLRAIITRGLRETTGNYKLLVELFNMDRGDYKRFLNFLRKQKCQVPFSAFRTVRPIDPSADPLFAASGGERHTRH
jgi:DNA-binding NtrC family response regulator